jgi:hypothetical protein
MVKTKEDLTGKVFGNLVVIRQAEDYISPGGQKHAMWLCQCQCGNPNTSVLEVRGLNLKNGHTKSCGHCGNGYNESDLNLSDENGIYGIGYCSNTKTPFYFDMQDFETIRWFTWYEQVDHTGYHTLITKHNGNHIKMSQLLGCKYYDHADRNPLNNRRYNFRKATHADNARNRTIQKNNTSKIIGVNMDECGFWIARIQVNGKRKYLGYFANKDDAIRVRLEAEVKYYGEFAPQQHLYEHYGITTQN